MPQVQSVGQGAVWRISDNKDASGSILPPWKTVKVTNIFGFRRRPVVGGIATIVPLDVDIAPLNLKIVAIKEKSECGSRWWDVELESVSEKSFFEIAPAADRAQEFPFDVGIVYPAVKAVRQIKREALRPHMLPPGVALDTVKGAIDLTSDGVPDLLLVDYCCQDPEKPARACDYTCGKTFKKIGRAWRLINRSSPC
jgi:hypothetical protein